MGQQEVWRLEGYRVDESGKPVLLDNGEKELIAYQFPVDTMEWRAAEYGLHPVDDKDTILDIVMAEAWMSEEDYLEDEPRLYDCPDTETARKHHVSRCSRAKLKQRLATRKKVDNPMLRVRDESPIHPEILEMKRMFVDDTRRKMQGRKAIDPEAYRLKQWRELTMNKSAKEGGQDGNEYD